MSEYGDLLRDARLRAGVAQWVVAEVAGVTTSALQGWEKGRTIPQRGWYDFSVLDEYLELSPGSLAAAYERDYTSTRTVVNLIERQFGRLRVDELVHPSAGEFRYWRCTCACGNVTEVLTGNLQREKVTSCGCFRRDFISETKLKVLEGERVGRWTIGKRASAFGSAPTYWHAKCDCGTERLVASTSLIQGLSKSCGCNQRKRPYDQTTIQQSSGERLKAK